MGNALANLMLVIWPVVCLVMFRTMRLERALIWSILGGYLFLPPLTEFNLPFVPDMDKVTIPNLSVLLILMFAMKEKLQLWPHSRTALVLVTGVILSAVPTVLTNRDPILFEVLRDAEPIIFIVDYIPGQSLRDLGSALVGQLLIIVPFLLARQFLSSDEGLREILLALMIGGVVYSIPSLIEIRFSPQMNVWVYGFFQHDFQQMVREGGFRPIVFLPHALWLALFMVMALLSCAALVRETPALGRWKMLLLVAYLMMMVVLCKSLASQLYAIALLPVVLFLPARWQIRLACLFGLIAVAYPMLRNAHLIPLDWILEKAGEISADREQSLWYRFRNEEQLLDRAAEKPLFGWGAWGRNLFRDPETGIILTIPDGYWIIAFGSFGWLGYVSEFGLLALPLLLIWLSLRKDAPMSPYVAPLCLILGITMIDMLLNATLTPVIWMVAGAILGHAERRMPRSVKPPRYPLHGAIQGEKAGPPGKRTVL